MAVALDAPMLRGMITAPILSMLVIPAAYYLMRRRRVQRSQSDLLSLEERT